MASSCPGRNGAFFRRLGANTYDGILLFAVWILAAAPFAIYFVVQHQAHNPLLDQILHIWLPIVGFLYFAYGWTRQGQTFGMQAWRLRIFTVDHRKIGIGRALVRYILALALLLALIFALVLIVHGHLVAALAAAALYAISYLWIYVDGEAQTLHDRLAGTRVLYVPRGAAPPAAPGPNAATTPP